MSTLLSDIQAVNRRFMEAVKTADEEKFVGVYTDDTILLFPGREPLVGHEGVRAHFASLKTRGVREITLTTLEVEGFGDTAWERGTFVTTGSDQSVLGKGKYIVIWKRAAQGWKIHRDIVNASS